MVEINYVEKHKPNRMYVDPRNYDSMNQAFQEVGVREIPPKEISDLDEIGVGKRPDMFDVFIYWET